MKKEDGSKGRRVKKESREEEEEVLHEACRGRAG